MALPALQGRTVPLLWGCPSPTALLQGPHPILGCLQDLCALPASRSLWLRPSTTWPSPQHRNKSREPQPWARELGEGAAPCTAPLQLCKPAGHRGNHPLAASVTPGAAQGCCHPAPCVFWDCSGGCLRLGAKGKSGVTPFLLERPLPALSLQVEPASLTPLVPAGQPRALAVVPGLCSHSAAKRVAFKALAFPSFWAHAPTLPYFVFSFGQPTSRHI